MKTNIKMNVEREEHVNRILQEILDEMKERHDSIFDIDVDYMNGYQSALEGVRLFIEENYLL